MDLFGHNREEGGFSSYLRSSVSFGTRRANVASVLLLLMWLLAVIAVSTRHEVERDEVRALSIALEPASFWQLPSALKNEGHPVLWYLILRVAFWVARTPVVLKVASICVAFVGVVIFYRQAPFPAWQKILFLGGVLPLYEYSVISRNYGISMTLLFLFATLYTQKKKRRFLLVCVLAALANTNGHSCIIVGVLTALWFFDEVVIGRHSLHSREVAALVGVLVLFGIAAVFSVATITPSYDTFVRSFSPRHSQVVQALWMNVKHPGMRFDSIFPVLTRPLRDVLVWGLVAGLSIRPHVAAAFLGGTVLLGTFLSTISPNRLCHEGILMMFMVTLYWIVHEREASYPRGKLRRRFHFVHKASVYVVLSGILVAHIGGSARKIGVDMFRERSSNRAFGRFLSTHPEYHDAIILGEPDYLLESLPYYAPNRIYIPRERRFGDRVSWTSKPRMSLGELLTVAQQVKDSEKKPVLIALGHFDLGDQPNQETRYSYGKVWSWSLPELRAFRGATAKVAEFAAAVSDENYEIFLLL